MAAIGRIRKHGVLLMIIIGVALLAFIVGDLTNVVNRGRNTIAKIDGKKFEAGQNDNTYGEYYQQNYEYLKIAYSNSPILAENTNYLEQIAHQMTYEQIKHETILDKQLASLGLEFTDEMKAEISDKVLKTAGSPESPMGKIVQYALAEYTENVQDYQTANAIYQQIGQALQSAENMENQLNKESSLYRAYKAIERMYIIDAKENTYFGMAANSIHFSQKMLDQMANDNNRLNGQMCAIDFNNPAFDKIKIEISDKDAKAFFKEHKDRYTLRQTEKDVDLAYFVVNSTPDDMNAAAKLAGELFNKMQTVGVKEFSSEVYKFDKIDLQYAQNTNDPYSFSSSNSSLVAAFAQVDTNLYLKANETAMQKRNALSRNPNGYSSHATAMTADLDKLVHPSTMDSSVIAPRLYNNVIYFGQVRDIQNRPDSIKIARLFFPYKETVKEAKDMTKEQAYAKAMEVKAALDGQDSAAMIPFLKDYGTDSVMHPFILLDGASFDNMGYVYNPADTMVANMFNELINTNVNYCYLHENAANSVYFVDMVLYKSEPVLKSQYVLYPVPVMATTTTIKATQRNAAKAAACQSASDLATTAKKLGAEVVTAPLTNMQATVEVNGGLLDCREAVKWVYNNDKKAGNTVGSVASNPFRGTLTNINQMTGEITNSEVFIVAGIKSSVEMKDPSFKDVKDRVIRDMKIEKKRDAVVERLKKEFNGSNMAELASKYGSAAQPMNVAFSEYGRMESAAMGKIAKLTAGKHAVAGGVNFVYLVKVESVDKASDVKNQMTQQITAQIKAYQQADDKTAAAEAKKYVKMQYTEFAYRTVLAENAQAQQYGGGYPTVDVIKQLVYNDIENDIKMTDHRHLFYGAAAESNKR